MGSVIARTRFATLVAVGLALLVSGVVAGAAGGNFILGQANSAGTSNTSLTTSSTGTALLVTQNGSGTAIRGSTGSGSGIAGFFTSGSGSGVSGVVANANSYGVYAANDSATTGTGAALRVAGKENYGLLATSSERNAIVGTASGCTGFLCGANGVSGTGYGFAAGVFGDGTGSIAGLYANGGLAASVYATQSGDDILAIYGSSTGGNGIRGDGIGSTTIDACGTGATYYCAGGVFSGDNGLLAATATEGGYALFGADSTGTGSAWALVTSGDASINGDLFVNTCTGCAVAATAINGGDSTLKQGDAVTLLGVTTASDGSTQLVVGAAKKGDAVIGIVDRSMKLESGAVKAPASERTVKVPGKGEVTVNTPARTLKGQGSKWVDGGTSAPAGGSLRLIISGVFTMDAAISGVSAGDNLAVGDKAGKLGKAAADAKGIAGKYLGKLKDGRIVLMVSPR